MSRRRWCCRPGDGQHDRVGSGRGPEPRRWWWSTASVSHAVVVLTVGPLLGAVTWGAWLGWDRTASYDVVTSTVQSPYVTLQVLGCALTVGTVTAVLTALGHPVAGTAGVALGFWLVWTVDAASRDDSGLFVVGSMLLAFGLTLGTSVAAAVGWGVRSVADAVRRRRAGDS